APLARFPRGCEKRGKAAFAFPCFPWTRHFHSPSRPSVRSPRVRRFALASPQQYPSGRSHLPRPFGVAHLLRHRVQSRKAHPLLQVFLRLRQALPLLVWRRIVCLFVLPLPFAARIQAHRREATRTMKVQVWVEVRRVELVYRFGMFGGDVSVAYVLANDRPVLAFHQRIVLAPIGPAFGQLDQQMLEHFVHLVIDVFRAVVGMNLHNHEGKLMQDCLQHRQQILLADPPHAAHYLPLRHLVHRIDVIHPLTPFQSPWCTVSMRRKPGRPCGSGLRRSPMLMALGRVGSHFAASLRYPPLPRRLYRCATEISPRRAYSALPNCWCSRCIMRTVAGPLSQPCARSTSASRATS